MTYSPFGGLYFVGGAGGSKLGPPLQQWVYRNPYWMHVSVAPGTVRRSSAREVAARLVDDTALKEALGALTSPVGQAIEEAALSQWMDPVDAQLMTAALTQAFKIIRNQNVPVWRRTEVLIGVTLLIVVVGGIVVIAHRSKQASEQKPKAPSARKPAPRKPRRKH